MCITFSAIGPRPMGGDENSRLIYSEFTDSHSVLIALHGLKENRLADNAVRLEYHPDDWADAADISKYKLKIDEATRPAWVTDELLADWTEQFNKIVAPTIIKKQTVIIGGKWIAGPGKTEVKYAEHCTIVAVVGELEIETLGDGVAILYLPNSGSLTVKGDVYGSLTVGDVSGSLTVKGDVSGSLTVKGYVSGSLTVGDVSGSLTVGDVSGSLTVKGDVYKSASISITKIGDMAQISQNVLDKIAATAKAK